MSTSSDTDAFETKPIDESNSRSSQRPVERRSITLDVLRETAKNIGMGIPQVRALRLQRPRAGALYSGQDEELVRYAFSPLQILREALTSLEGLDVLEIGPGDFMTSGISMLAAGAKSYSVIDRFIGDYQKPEAKAWYKGIQNEWSRFFPELQWPEYLHGEDFPEAYSDRIEVLTGTIEEARSTRQYDVVCSFQVGEHVSDIDAFAEANARFLKPNGVAIHRFDFGPHGCWNDYEDRLTFLRFPNWLWYLMGSNRGAPNRLRYHHVCAAIENAGLTFESTGLEYFTEDVVRRARLAKNLRGSPFESLLIGTAVFVCRP